MQTNPSYDRYLRQIRLREMGTEGQDRLLRASVIVIGAGGLGCPALLYLASGGLGKIGIIDHDKVALHDLHRQTLYTMEDIGKPKAFCSADRLRLHNPDIRIMSYDQKLSTANALDILGEYEFVLDCTDNFATRYLVNDACFLLGKPLVFGAVSRYAGQLAIFNMRADPDESTVNYRDLFPEQPQPDEALNCEEEGVLGPIPGIIGTLMATELIKLITGIGRPLINKLMNYDSLNNETYTIRLSPLADSEKHLPPDFETFRKTDYEMACSNAQNITEISQEEFEQLLENPMDLDIIDVRNPGESPEFILFPTRQIPLAELPAQLSAIEKPVIVFVCQTGVRSLKAANLLAERLKRTVKIHSLRGGINSWIKKQKS